MRFLYSVLLLIGIVSVIGLPYFIGHGLALMPDDHALGWHWIWIGIAFGIFAAIIIFIVTRLNPGTPDGDHHTAVP